MTKRIALLLSGCGTLDGSDIHETVLTLLALDRAGVEVVPAAPDIDQFHVLNHLTQEEATEARNVRVESARMVCGNVAAIDALSPQTVEGLVLPGGFGAVKNLSSFAIKGPQGGVNPKLAELLRQMHAATKPIGAIGISPVTVVMALQQHHPSVTTGTDAGTAAAIRTMGGEHHPCRAGAIWVDPVNNIVSTPGYRPGAGIGETAAGIDKLVQKLIDLPKACRSDRLTGPADPAE
jgi:enhancing lycopene biosynthesis protein 2